ncbi:TPA: hypothetical protein N0F65_000635 [Lagenidium giganteum]|uniref:Uncharacterized protein n=1 Tax=Lagenidium giganteum TaxID=4803 RepID=A0AAV2YS94_9STRA|nr:TPA: hypothetical protein N0F65_000635 [Lagenidium giganteum]
MIKLLEITIVALALLLAGITWYLTLMPHWLVQSGHRDASNYYAQGIGLWLNYTEHVGDATFDPGNSLWVPVVASGVQTFEEQCAVDRGFCKQPTGELHRQYCTIMSAYCGLTTTIMQFLTSVISGLALLAVIWSFLLVKGSQRTVIDAYLMQICIFNGIGFLSVATIWYFAMYRVIMDTTFFKDQYSRCSENPKNRSCWAMGPCVYMVISAAVGYPILSVLVATHVTDKFRRFQRALRKLYESTTHVELPAPDVTIKSQNVNSSGEEGGDSIKAPPSSTGSQSGRTQIDLAAQQSLPSLRRIDLKSLPSSVQSFSDDDDRYPRRSPPQSGKDVV